MTAAIIFTFAFLTTPIAIVKRAEINPSIQETETITEYLLYRVAFKAAIVLRGGQVRRVGSVH